MWKAILVCVVTAIPVLAAPPTFLPGSECEACHRLVPGYSSTGAPLRAPVAHHTAWKATIMAHASQDPYWLAKVMVEKSAHREAPVSVDTVCMRCHAPMQAVPAEHAGKSTSVETVNSLGLDGVACLVCHQILPGGLGEKRTFTGKPGFSAEPVAFGPHANPFSMPMLHHTGVTPTESAHILSSALCGSCHTVLTPTLNEKNEIVGEFLEQAPYLEWLAAGGDAKASCQSCHVPRAVAPESTDDRFFIAHNPGGRAFPPTQPRAPFGVHSFAGANAQILDLLAGGEDPADAFAASVSRTRQNLRRAAALKVEPVREAGELVIRVRILNLTGHKLPTGFPSRRMWLHLTLKDSAGNALFESGSFDATTHEIVSEDPAVNRGNQAHLDEIRSPQQVALYETEMADAAGRHTHSLLNARRLLKDNRLLPRGFDLQRPLPAGISPESLAPAGVAADANFLPGSDTVTYRIPATLAAKAAEVSAELLYQSIKPAHLRELRGKGGATADELVDRLQNALGSEVLAATRESLTPSPQ